MTAPTPPPPDPGDPWALPEPEPTNLLALWPDDRAPTRSEIVAALQATWDEVKVIEDIDPDDPDVPWASAIDAPMLHQPAILWCEPARPLPAGELDDSVAEACPWAIGLETMLDADDPVSSYRDLVRLLATTFPDSPGILDVNSTSWLKRQALDARFVADGAEPPADALWIIHAVSAEQTSATPGAVWLHTHGLWRCGRPELEMLEVEPAFVASAARLVNEVAERLLDVEPPPPAAPLDVGEQLSVTLHPWHTIIDQLAAGAPGGLADREDIQDGNVHQGVRAVVCGDHPHGGPRKQWSWPKDVLQRLDRDEAVLFKTRRATDRMARQARHTWGELATAFVKLQPFLPSATERPRAVVLVKVAFQYEDEPSEDAPAEHLWFEALRFEREVAEGKLLNDPIHVPSLKREQVCTLARDHLTDWLVQTEQGHFGPGDLDGLWRAVDTLATSTEHST